MPTDITPSTQIVAPNELATPPSITGGEKVLVIKDGKVVAVPMDSLKTEKVFRKIFKPTSAGQTVFESAEMDGGTPLFVMANIQPLYDDDFTVSENGKKYTLTNGVPKDTKILIIYKKVA